MLETTLSTWIKKGEEIKEKYLLGKFISAFIKFCDKFTSINVLHFQI